MSLKTFLASLLSGERVGNPFSKGGGDWKEKRKSNRVDLHEDDQIDVYVLRSGEEDFNKAIVARAKNISLRGCRLVFNDPGSLGAFETGATHLMSLSVNEVRIPIQMDVLRAITDTELAVRFKPPFPKELERLERFLEPRCLGVSVREINPGSLQGSVYKGLRWFQGINDTNLFSWFDPVSGEIIQQQLVFLGAVVEWKSGEPIKTGSIRQDQPSVDFDRGWVKAELMEFSDAPEKSILDQARAIIDSMEIDPGVKSAFLKKFESPQR